MAASPPPTPPTPPPSPHPRQPKPSQALPSYLRPYLEAARTHGGGFPSLLWASQETQAARFDAFTRIVDFRAKSVLDVGAGRADFLDFLKLVGHEPSEYIGIEAVPDLAEAAKTTGAQIIQKDFIAEPLCMFVGCDIVAISGALNTAPDDAFYSTLKRAWDATAHDLVFNFLSSTNLAAAEHLYWRTADAVERYCVNVLSVRPRILADYLHGDTTFLLTKKHY